MKRGDELSARCWNYGRAEGGAGRGAECLGVPDTDGAGQGNDAVGREGLGGANDGAQVSGILESGRDNEKRLARGEDFLEGEGWSFGERGDGLRGFGGDGAREDVGWELDDFGVGAQYEVVQQVEAAATDEEGGDVEATAEGFFDEVLAFEGDQSGVGYFAAPEGGAQFFYPGVLPALYNANMRVI